MYVCDPVMGDSEPVGWYVPKELLPIYRDEILPLCDLCVPNQFEAELLSGTKITDETSAFQAMTRYIFRHNYEIKGWRSDVSKNVNIHIVKRN